jgi:hypothetical protein
MEDRTMKRTNVGVSVLALVALAGCQNSVYYGTMEKLGYHKRDILVSRVKETRDDQEAAKKQFQTTLQQFSAVVHFNGGSLQAEYEKLNTEYDRSVARADAVHSRIKSVESVSGALFDEWKGEIKEYHSDQLRQQSQQELDETQAKYKQLLAAMKRAEAKMQPVLDAFHDQVLFLKHSLNAQAIASLEGTRASLETDVNGLIADMDRSIKEADEFIGQMKDK